tara:strand:- start:318 stop:536 length:219 start_codon:yes stop_codon:yes gene_type:complete
MNNELKEATEYFKENKEYLECPSGCGAVYHESAFTHNPFECKDCKTMFKVPSRIKIRKPRHFKKKKPIKQGA